MELIGILSPERGADKATRKRCFIRSRNRKKTGTSVEIIGARHE